MQNNLKSSEKVYKWITIDENKSKIEIVKVLSYIKKQHIGDTEAVEEVLKLWK